MKRKEINERLADIIAFADIRQFIDAPIFTYSQGMLLRLGFAVAVNVDPDILILDENITAGDKDFQKKSLNKVNGFFREGKTIIIVSQWMEFMRKNCNKIITFKEGKIIAKSVMKGDSR